MIRFNLDLSEQEVGYLVNVALAAQPIRDALPLMQNIVAQTQEQAAKQQTEYALSIKGVEEAIK